MSNNSTTHDNKALIARFFAVLSPADLPHALDMLAADAEWTVVGDPRRFAYAGSNTKPAMAVQLGAFFGGMAALRWTLTSMTAEGDRVAAEAESLGQTADGRPYHNYHHILFVIRAGHILSAREYLDPLAVLELTGEMQFTS